MYRLIKLLFILTPFFFVSCLDVVEEIELNADNSGVATYTFNLSQSKIKIGAAMKLDSIAGQKVPKSYEIEREIRKAVAELQSKEGITKANYKINEDEFIYTLKVNFKNLTALNTAINNMSYWKKSKWKPSDSFYSQNGNKVIKRGEKIVIPTHQLKQIEKQKENLSIGKYVFILRSHRLLSVLPESELKLSGNNKAIMFRSNLYDLIKRERALVLEAELR